jgi:AcrR family transcriptional regulator
MTSLTATLRDRRRQQAIDEIAGVAHELFLRKGFDRVSVEDIADAAGCSARTFYRYFGSKEEVLFYDLPALHDQLVNNLDELLASGAQPWSAVTEAMALLVEQFGAENERIARDRMQLWLSEPALRSKYMQYIASTEEDVTNLLKAAGPGGPEDEELAALRAVAAIGAYRATLLEHHSDSDGPALAAHLRAACALIGDGLGDRKLKAGGRANSRSKGAGDSRRGRKAPAR